MAYAAAASIVSGMEMLATEGNKGSTTNCGDNVSSFSSQKRPKCNQDPMEKVFAVDSNPNKYEYKSYATHPSVA